MQIEQRSVGGVVVVDVTGKVTLGESTELLKDKVNSLVNQGHKNLVSIFETFDSELDAVASFATEAAVL